MPFPDHDYDAKNYPTDNYTPRPNWSGGSMHREPISVLADLVDSFYRSDDTFGSLMLEAHGVIEHYRTKGWHQNDSRLQPLHKLSEAPA